MPGLIKKEGAVKRPPNAPAVFFNAERALLVFLVLKALFFESPLSALLFIFFEDNF